LDIYFAIALSGERIGVWQQFNQCTMYNCHSESPLYNKYIPIKMGKKTPKTPTNKQQQQQHWLMLRSVFLEHRRRVSLICFVPLMTLPM
jgi:hypothetical protein